MNPSTAPLTSNYERGTVKIIATKPTKLGTIRRNPIRVLENPLNSDFTNCGTQKFSE